MQCVDCVRQQAVTSRSATTVFGGRLREGRPVVTFALIGTCVVVFLLQLAGGAQVTERFDFWPAAAAAEPWRFLTSAFLHSTSFPLHIVFNMYVLYLVGPSLETALGRLRYLALYLVCGLGGSVGYLLLADPLGDSWKTGALGASGAVFGLFGALVVVRRHLRLDSSSLFVTIGINLVIGFVFTGIAWQAHLGGLATGLALGAVMTVPSGPRRSQLQLIGTLAVVAALVVLAVVKLSTAGAV